MKSKTYLGDLRAKDVRALREDVISAKKELFNLRFQNTTNQLENISRISQVRKNIARINTVITEKTKVKGAD